MSAKRTKKTLKSQQTLYTFKNDLVSEREVWQDEDGTWWEIPEHPSHIIIEPQIVYPQPEPGELRCLKVREKEELGILKN